MKTTLDCVIRHQKPLNCFINGLSVAPEGGKTTITRDPNVIDATGETSLVSYLIRDASSEQISAAINAAAGTTTGCHPTSNNNDNNKFFDQSTTTNDDSLHPLSSSRLCLKSGPSQWAAMSLDERYRRLRTIFTTCTSTTTPSQTEKTEKEKNKTEVNSNTIDIATNNTEGGSAQKDDNIIHHQSESAIAALIANHFAEWDALETGIHTSITTDINSGLVGCALDVMEKTRDFLRAEGSKRLSGRHGYPIRCARAPRTPVVIIAPWNVPCGTIMPKLIAALLCGCSVIVKPSERASRSICALVEAIATAVLPTTADSAAPSSDRTTTTVNTCNTEHSSSPLAETCLPPGVLQVLTGGPSVGEALVKSPLVAAVQFTGAASTAATIQSELGKKLCPFLAECGGSNALIVDRGADIQHAVAAVVQGMTALNGQWCMGISRLIVHEEIRGAFLEVLKDAFDRRVVVARSNEPIENVLSFLHQQQQREVCTNKSKEDETHTKSPSCPTTFEKSLTVSPDEDGEATTTMGSQSNTSPDYCRRQPTVSSILSGIEEELSIVGPMAFYEHKRNLERAIAASGAKDVLLLGRVMVPSSCDDATTTPTTEKKGEKEEENTNNNASCFFRPRLLLDGDLSYLSKAELFGPVAALFTFSGSLHEAIRMANMADGQLCCYLFVNPSSYSSSSAELLQLSSAFSTAEPQKEEKDLIITKKSGDKTNSNSTTAGNVSDDGGGSSSPSSPASKTLEAMEALCEAFCPLVNSGMIMVNGISFGFEVSEGEEHPMGDFVGMAGSGADGNAEALARFFTAAKWYGVNGSKSACK